MPHFKRLTSIFGERPETIHVNFDQVLFMKIDPGSGTQIIMNGGSCNVQETPDQITMTPPTKFL